MMPLSPQTAAVLHNGRLKMAASASHPRQRYFHDDGRVYKVEQSKSMFLYMNKFVYLQHKQVLTIYAERPL